MTKHSEPRHSAVRVWIAAWLTTTLCLLSGTALAGSEVDLLIDKLVERGLLSQEDAKQLVDEMAEARKSIPQQSLDAPPARPAATASGWFDRVSLKGDMRVRYQHEELDNLAEVPGPLDLSERKRTRIRWRVGAVADVNDAWEVGFGLASGGTDPRSTNQTLSGGFSTKDARLDYAYARYAPGDSYEVLAGKFKNPIWTPKDLLWDSDIRPEGASATFNFAMGENMTAYLTPMAFVLTDDVTENRDMGRMFGMQAGLEWAASDRVDVKFAPTVYIFDNLKGTSGPVGVSAPTNSRDAQGNLIYDYDSLTLGGSVKISDLGRVGGAEFFGEYVNAFDPDDDNTGYLLGVTLGRSVKDFGDWSFKYSYRRLERDAWPEFLPDSDFFFGATNVKGNEIDVAFGITKNVSVSMDYYFDAKLIGTDIEQDLVQLDLNLKW